MNHTIRMMGSTKNTCYPLYVDMNTRKESANKELMVDFGDKSKEAAIKACGYALEDMSFGWSVNPKKPMTMILNYDIGASNPMYWHGQFTFVLQRNQGIMKSIEELFVLCQTSLFCYS